MMSDVRHRHAQPRGVVPIRFAPATVFLVVIVVFTAIMRVASSGHSLWFDELASVFFASQPVARLWSAWMLRETNPPLFYTVLHGWTALAGLSEVALRLPGILASLAAMAIVHTGIRSHYGHRAAVIATLLMAASAQQFYFAVQARSYMPLFLAISVSFFGAVGLVQPGPAQRRAWIAFVGGALVGIYLHTTALLWPAAVTIALMLVDRRYVPLLGDRWRHLLLADVLVLSGSLWWMWITVHQMRSPEGNIGWIGHPKAIEVATTFATGTLLAHEPHGWDWLGLVATGAAAVFGVARTWRNSATRLALACYVLSALFFLVANARQPIIIDRTVFWLSLFNIILAAAGLASIRVRRVRWLAPAVVISLLMPNLAHMILNLQVEDWRTPVVSLARQPGAILVVNGEAVSVAVRMACAVDLRMPRCPFPVVTLVTSGPQLDAWGIGSATPLAQPVPPGPVFLFRRWCHDPYKLLQTAGMLAGTTPPTSDFSGPYPYSILTEIPSRTIADHGLLRVATAGPCV
nr:glycosyltransferase family 39 protein [Sphingomonas populi]